MLMEQGWGPMVGHGLADGSPHLLSRTADGLMSVRRATHWLATCGGAVQGFQGQAPAGCRCCSLPGKALQAGPGGAGAAFPVLDGPAVCTSMPGEERAS